MGASTFYNSIRGTDARAAFNQLTEQSQYESGHSYSGEIGMKSTFVHIATVDTLQEARELAARLIDAEDPRVDDKWGPAGCIAWTKAKADDEAGDVGGFTFFGWASS